jgi:predicted TPR repeat methyltransferase
MSSSDADPPPVSPSVARARSLSSVQEAATLYGEWASTYDADVFADLGFTGSARIADLLAGVLPDPNQPVVDLGCGTGAVGRRLVELGVTTVDGVDLSPEMLAVAESTGAYRRLTASDLNDLPTDLNARYAASISAGTFTTGHVGPEAVPGLMRLLRPGGFVAWVIASTTWPRFEPMLATNAFDVLHQETEPIRRHGPREAVMFVARVAGTG